MWRLWRRCSMRLGPEGRYACLKFSIVAAAMGVWMILHRVVGLGQWTSFTIAIGLEALVIGSLRYRGYRGHVSRRATIRLPK